MKNRRNQTNAVSPAVAPPAAAPLPTIRISFSAPDVVLSIPGASTKSLALAHRIAATYIENSPPPSGVPRIAVARSGMSVELLLARVTGMTVEPGVIQDRLRIAAQQEVVLKARPHGVGVATHAVEVRS